MAKLPNTKPVLLVRGVRVALDEAGQDPLQLAASHLGVGKEQVVSARVVRRSLDARRGKPRFVLSLRVKVESCPKNFPPGTGPAPKGKKLAPPRKVPGGREILVVGTGPAGLFAARRLCEAGIEPVLIERGQDLPSRMRDVAGLLSQGRLLPESNFHFGLGGAGAFSDGKLYTRIQKSEVLFVLEVLQQHGAGTQDQILVEAHPHVGTDRWPVILKSLRQELTSRGCRFRFNTRVCGLTVYRRKLAALRLADGELGCQGAILAPGNSARDLFEALHAAGVPLAPKPFALGVRLSHPQEVIDRIQYGSFAGHPALPAASYRLAGNFLGRGVYTFCMCPGGLIIPTPTEPGLLALNGMSNAARDSKEANAAVVVSVSPEELGPVDDPLSGIRFQRTLEQAAYRAGSGGYRAPAQGLQEFLSDRRPKKAPVCNYRPGVAPADLAKDLPGWLSAPLRQGLASFCRKLPGLDHPKASVLGFETRTSSPVRILRAEDGMSPEVAGLFPAGEGSGYAGGIVSSAVDGIRAADALIAWLAARTS